MQLIKNITKHKPTQASFEILPETMVMNAAKKRAQLTVAWLILLTNLATAAARALYGCNHTCGNVSVPYPFGMGKSSKTGENCFLNQSFNLTCDNSTLFLGNVQVSHISLPGQMEMSLYVSKVCYKEGQKLQSNKPFLRTPYFPISSKQNKFITVGCDSYGYLDSFQKGKRYSTGCLTRCGSNRKTEIINREGACFGIGCCQVDIPPGMQNIKTEASSFNNLRNVSDFNNCSYAFVAKTGWYKFDEAHFTGLPFDKARVVFDWYVGDETCNVSRNRPNFACKNNSKCLDADNGDGYHCICKSGYEGNPYHPDGCRDIDECNSETSKHDCTSDDNCRNTDGSYACIGPGEQNSHTVSPNPKGCSKVEIIIISILCPIAGSVILVGGSSWLYQVYQTVIRIKLRLNLWRNAESKLKQELATIKDSSGKAEIFTKKELKKATNNYAKSLIVGRGGSGDIFKGILANHENRVVAIKKSKAMDEHQIDKFIEGVVKLSQVTHRHLVKLVGCCLETQVPLLVYEFVPNGNLFDYIHKRRNASDFSLGTWLRIAAEAAEALSYLHSIHIVHGDFKTKNILLGENCTVKVSNFGASMLVPSHQTELIPTEQEGSLGYLEPEYTLTYQLTDKSDVYCFGVVLVELLAKKKAFSIEQLDEERSLAVQFLSCLIDDNLDEFVAIDIVTDGDNKEKLQEVSELAKQCLSEREKRPSMEEVAHKLKQITRTEEQHPLVAIGAKMEKTDEIFCPDETPSISDNVTGAASILGIIG